MIAVTRLSRSSSRDWLRLTVLSRNARSRSSCFMARLPDLDVVVVAGDNAPVLHDVGLHIVPSPVTGGSRFCWPSRRRVEAGRAGRPARTRPPARCSGPSTTPGRGGARRSSVIAELETAASCPPRHRPERGAVAETRPSGHGALDAHLVPAGQDVALFLDELLERRAGSQAYFARLLQRHGQRGVSLRPW